MPVSPANNSYVTRSIADVVICVPVARTLQFTRGLFQAINEVPAGGICAAGTSVVPHVGIVVARSPALAPHFSQFLKAINVWSSIRERGMMAGIALNPGTPLSHLEEVVDDVDLVLVMSVNPGFGGQAYIPASTGKIRRVRQLLDLRRSSAALEVDGGITTETIRTAWEAGADTFVAGTAVFGKPDPAAAVKALKAKCTVTT